MTRLLSLFVVAGSLCSVFPPRARAAERPNIVFILIDDLGPEWLSCYGSEHRTPNIDRVAASGMRFDRVYATPLCSPTRHEMLTGRYPFRTGWTTHWDSPRWGGQYFDWNREITFPRVLRDAGYDTAITGKWQINDLRVQKDALKRHGFDHYCVWPGYETGNPPSAERYFEPFLEQDGVRGTRKGAFGPDEFARYTTDFISRKREKPFLAYHAEVLVHTPFTKTPHNKDGTLEKAALHPGMLDYVDETVGRILGALEKSGRRDNTIVIITADNGTVSGVHGRRNGRDVNGGKGTLRETGIRMPLLISWPKHIKPGSVSQELVDFSDFFPTLIELAGGKLPEGVTIDGKSFAPTLLGKPREQKRDWIYSQLGPNRVISDGTYKLWHDGRFFNVEKDPYEEKPLGDKLTPEAKAARDALHKVLSSLPPDARLPFDSKPPKGAGE